MQEVMTISAHRFYKTSVLGSELEAGDSDGAGETELSHIRQASKHFEYMSLQNSHCSSIACTIPVW